MMLQYCDIQGHSIVMRIKGKRLKKHKDFTAKSAPGTGHRKDAKFFFEKICECKLFEAFRGLLQINSAKICEFASGKFTKT